MPGTPKPTVVFVRHGATEFDRPAAKKDRIAGWQTIGLASEGRSEAFRAGEWLRDKFKIARLNTSDLLRAYDTARIIRAVHPADSRPEIYPSESLRPMNVGIYENQLEEEAREDLLDFILNKPGQQIPGGESYEAHLKDLLPEVRDSFDRAKAHPERGAEVNITHSRNFPDIRGHWMKDFKENEVDEKAIREGVSVEPGELVCYVWNGKGWSRRVHRFAQAPAAAA